MTQHDYVIDNQSFPATRTDLNNVLQAIVSNNSGTSAPSTTFANQIWYDSSANILYIRNEDNDANIPLLQFDQSADVAATLATVIDILDASGTNQAGTALTIRGGAGTGTGAGGSVIIQTADGGSSGSSVNSHATVVTITDDGKVGVGVAAPDALLHVQDVAASTATHVYTKVHIEDSDHLALQFSGGTGGETWIWFADDTTSTPVGGITYFHGGPYMAFRVESAERMRIDSSGRLLVGKTTNAIGTAGCNVQGDGFLSATRSGAQCAGFNRLSDDGNITEFRQDGTLIGAIGSSGSDLYIASGSGAGLLLDGSTVLPANGSGVAVDNDRDLGSSSHRWRDIFTNGAVTTTSDQNKKQQIATLTSAEIAAAKRISALFKTFKFNNAVTKKGDSARIHAGVIAQEVYTALEAEGLDATKYAFWCSDTFWEKDVEVPAVEAKDAVTRKYTDTDGTEIEEVVTPAVEASDAYTRTDTYNTKDEAPEGATETTRLSVRYAELLAFVGAATEQRLADIETRLAALEG